MQVLDVRPLKLDRWLQIIEGEYFAEYLPAGGAAAKFVVADSATLAHLVPAAGTLAARHGMLSVHVSAGATRLHMLQDVFFAIAGALPWDDLLRRYLEVDRAWRDHLLVAITVEEVYGSVASTLVRSGHASWV